MNDMAEGILKAMELREENERLEAVVKRQGETIVSQSCEGKTMKAALEAIAMYEIGDSPASVTATEALAALVSEEQCQHIFPPMKFGDPPRHCIKCGERV